MDAMAFRERHRGAQCGLALVCRSHLARCCGCEGAMADLEHLSLYAEWDASAQGHFVKNFPARGERTPEPVVLERLAHEGWKLTSVAPTYEHRVLRLVTRHGDVRSLRSRPATAVGQEVEIAPGVSLKFLGVTRLREGGPDLSLLGHEDFVHGRMALYTALISISREDLYDSEQLGDLACQFLYRSVDGTYHDNVHDVERLALHEAGLIVGMPFGIAQLEPRIPLRRSRFEFLIFTGDGNLSRTSRLLVRYPFTIAPG
jgi:hypothetical protein